MLDGRGADCEDMRGRVARRGVFKGAMHLFGSVSPNRELAQIGYLPIPEAGSGWWPKCPPAAACASTWLVSTTGDEIQRSISEEAVGPLHENLFLPQNALPAGASRSIGRTQIKAVITANTGSGERRFFADVGQAIEIQADTVSVDWMAPSDETNQFFDVGMAGKRPTPEPTAVGIVIDARVGVEVALIENPIGLFDVVFTNHLVVPLNTRGTIPVPPFARAVTINQAATLGAASVQWEMHYGDPALLATTVEHGAIPFIPGLRKTEPGIELGDTTHLRTDTDANANRFFTLRWTIRP